MRWVLLTHKVGKPSTLNEAHQKLFSPRCGQLRGWDAACLEAEVSLQTPQCHLEAHLKMHSVTQAQTRTLILCVVIDVITSDLGHRFIPLERRFPSFYVFRLSTYRIPTGNHKPPFNCRHMECDQQTDATDRLRS